MPTLAHVESRDVNLSLIKLPKGFNLREEVDFDDKEIADLADSIAAVGLIMPLVVRPSPGGGESFDLMCGFRRYAALKMRNVRGTVPVRVLTCDTAADAVIMNIVENTARKDVHSADLARRLFQLEQGVYPGVAIDKDGSGAVPVDRKTICERTSLSPGYVGNLIRAWSNLVDKVRREWRRKDIPTDVVIKWGKLKTEEEQVAAFEAWKAEMAAAAERKAAGLKREKKGKEKETAADGDAEREGPKPKKVIATLLEKFTQRRETEHLPARDLDVVDAKIATLRWVLGETKRLTFT